MDCCCLIYILKNHVNDKVYIGQTWRPLSRRKRIAESYRHSPHLNNAIKKYGKKQFYYELLTVAHTQEIADYWEIYFIAKYKSADNKIGYNIRDGGSRGKQSEETKRKISFANSGEKNGMFGKKASPEALSKKSEAMRGEKNPFYGKKHSEELLAKIAASNRGRISSMKGKKHSEETIAKIKIGRANRPDNPRFNEEEIKAIRHKRKELNQSVKQIAEEYNVHISTIYRVINGTETYTGK